jgi:UDPglucose 6-dehydrogenase
MRIAVIGGTGYVGLTTAVCLAAKGHTVYCVGRNEDKIRQLLAGRPIIYEESLEELLKDTLSKGIFIPSTDLKNAVGNSEISFICVGTPSRDDGSIDLSQIEEASKGIGLALREDNGYKVVVVKSTVLPGTTENLVVPTIEKFSHKKVGVDFGVCMNPEFLREGLAVNDFLFPKETGIVIGELDKKSGDILFNVYKEFDAKILRTSIRAAETIKYARNCYLAKDISFANEIANICQKLVVDYLDVKGGVEMDARIGKGRFLDAGAGFGGSCFPKDVKAIVAKAKEVGIKPVMLEATLRVNDAQPYKIVELTKQVLGQFEGKKIGVLGLAFKPGTDDMREAVSIKVINAFLLEGAEVFAYDPKALDNAKKIFGGKIVYVDKAKEALSDVDVCVIVTEWPEFADPRLYDHMRNRVIIDGRRVLDPSVLGSGFTYNAVGFPKAVKTRLMR